MLNYHLPPQKRELKTKRMDTVPRRPIALFLSALVALWFLLPLHIKRKVKNFIKYSSIFKFISQFIGATAKRNLSLEWKCSKPLIPSSRPGSPKKVQIMKIDSQSRCSIVANEPNNSILLSFQQLEARIIASLKPTPPLHLFSGNISKASSWLHILLPINPWQDPKVNGSITVRKLPIVGLDLPFVRGDGIISGKWSPEEIASVIRNKKARLECN